jgi:hypothetical protein
MHYSEENSIVHKRVLSYVLKLFIDTSVGFLKGRRGCWKLVDVGVENCLPWIPSDIEIFLHSYKKKKLSMIFENTCASIILIIIN